MSMAARAGGGVLLSGRANRIWEGTRISPLQAAVTFVVGLVVAAFLVPSRIDLAGVAVAAGIAVTGAVFVRHPKWCLVSVVAATIVGLYRVSVPLGPLDLRLSDAPLAVLMVWAVHRRGQNGRAARNRVGQLPLALLLVVFGASLVASYGAIEGEFLDLVVSLARAVATFSLVWLVPYAATTPSDRLFVLRAFVLVAAGELAVALFRAADAGFPERLRGENGPNAEGLIAVLVLVAILNLPLFKARYRFLLGVLAVACLILTKSIASIAALMIVLGLLGVRAAAPRNPRNEALVRPARAIVLLIGAVLLVGTVRPQDLPTRSSFDSSSSASRVSLGYAGIRIFLGHPVLGVGWQRSSSPEVIGSAAVVDRVKARFSRVREDLLPGEESTVSVHNAYIQVLAEGGVIGLAVLLAALVLGRRGAKAVVARAGAEAAMARTIVALLVVILVWFNDNPIYGAQPETVMFAVFLGLLASVSLSASASPEPEPGPGLATEPVSPGAGSALRRERTSAAVRG